MSWTWGKLQLPETDNEQSVAVELANYLAELMVRAGQDSVIGPDGTVYDIEISVRIAPAESAVTG